MKHNFSFNGIWSMTQGVELIHLPSVPRPALRGKSLTVQGRHGDLWLPEDAYSNIKFDMECRTTKNAIPGEVSAWLTGFGPLAFSDRPEYCYRARLVADYDYERFLPGMNQPQNFKLRCDCQPFLYRANADAIQLTKAGSIVNPGTLPSDPLLHITGTGTITVTINGQVIRLTGMSGKIIIDSEAKEAYNGTQSLNSKMSGSFPVLSLGRNNISWTGSVSNFTLYPNWRWL